MSINDYSVLPLLLEDVPTLAEFVQESKLCLTVNRLLFKNWPAYDVQKEHYGKGVCPKFDDPLVTRFKVIHNDSKEVVGHLVVTRVKPVEAKPDDASSSASAPDYFDAGVLAEVKRMVSELDTERAVDRLDLTWIYIRPEHRGKGLGSQLVQKAVELAHQDGLPLTLTTEPGACDFFKHRGFKEKKYAEVDLAKWAPPYTGFGLFRLTRFMWTK